MYSLFKFRWIASPLCSPFFGSPSNEKPGPQQGLEPQGAGTRWPVADLMSRPPLSRWLEPLPHPETGRAVDPGFPGTSLCQASLPQQLFPSESQGKGEVRAPPDLAGLCTWCFLSLPTGLQGRSRCSATAVSHTGGNTRPPYCRLTLLLIAFITFIYFLLTHSVFG